MIKLELLAPAKDYEHGVAAINYGADAVYIGAPKFGARSAAGNSMEDIKNLAQYAHIFGAKVYMAINTILYDDELKEAERLAIQAWEVGVDALIVQDMAFLEMSLPPIALHSSTQGFNFTPEKVKFLEEVGFSRAILERGSSIEQMKEISQKTNIEIEAFIHGAICVCYSGQCYMSEVISGRSGNRGECQQPCRWDYNLVDENHKKIIEGKHLLSVADLNLSGNLEQLIDTGITSFKIEGRLKDMAYLKNSVSYYREALDAIILRNKNLEKSSQGDVIFDFTPDPQKSFTRGFTSYYLTDKDNKVSSFYTPKSIGRYLGTIKSVKRDSFVIDGSEQLANGDGICFLSDGSYIGTNVNIADGVNIFPNRMDGIYAGTEIYRNYDHKFIKSLDISKTRRAIPVNVEFVMSNDKITLKLIDKEGVSIEKTVHGEFEVAQNIDKAKETIITQLKKTGDSPFRINKVELYGDNVIFITVSQLNALRRDAVQELIDARLNSYIKEKRALKSDNAKYPQESLSYLANITNSLSERFYREHGVTTIEKGAELSDNHIGRVVMRTKYCIRREIGECLKEKTCKYRGTLHIENNYNIFGLKFDCAQCEMSIVYKGKKENQ